MTVTASTQNPWGGLAQPISADTAAADDPVWKDNAFLAFWDSGSQVFGSLHVSTSPNAPSARRARFSVSVGGHTTEIVEPLDAGTFRSESIDFGLDGRFTVDNAAVQAELSAVPLFTALDYSTVDLIPALVPDKPLQHFEQAASVTGEVQIAGTVTRISARGMRDRSSGFRDESVQWVEYAAFVAVTETYFISALKFLHIDGTQNGHGFLVEETGVTPINDLHLTRNAAAQLLRIRLDLADGSTRSLHTRERHGGFWVPMGPAEAEGPAFGAYDDFLTLESEDGTRGGGFTEQGVLHRVA
ncbi:hypothetical protein ACWEKT_33800 [Nocardia takedensis]